MVKRVALHYLYGDMGLDEDSMISILLDTADVKYIKDLISFIGYRLKQEDVGGLKSSELKKLVELWQMIIDQTKDNAKREALKMFGVWFSSGKFEPQWALGQLTDVASKAGDIYMDHAVLEHMKTLVEKYPLESIKALSAMVDGAKESWSISFWDKDAVTIVSKAYNSADDGVKQLADDLVNKLIAMGYYKEYRSTILDQN